MAAIAVLEQLGQPRDDAVVAFDVVKDDYATVYTLGAESVHDQSTPNGLVLMIARFD